MTNPVCEINGTTYEFARTLRVAYEVQNRNNHKPYTEVFSSIGDMTIEKQIEMLYVAFKIANPEVAKTFTDVMFREYYLDHYSVNEVLEQLKQVISGVLGKDISDVNDKSDEGNE